MASINNVLAMYNVYGASKYLAQDHSITLSYSLWILCLESLLCRKCVTTWEKRDDVFDLLGKTKPSCHRVCCSAKFVPLHVTFNPNDNVA